MNVRKILLKIFLTLLIFLLSLVLVVFVLVSRYMDWEKSFESSLVEQNISSSDEDIFSLIQEKFSSFTLSQDNTETISLSPKDVGMVVISIANGYLNNDLSISRVYIEPSKGKWVVYIEAMYSKYSVWLSLGINKDNLETAQLYLTSLSIGPYSVGEYFNILESINLGIANSLLTVNENGFSGRYFENIELLEDSMVIKGSRY